MHKRYNGTNFDRIKQRITLARAWAIRVLIACKIFIPGIKSEKITLFNSTFFLSNSKFCQLFISSSSIWSSAQKNWFKMIFSFYIYSQYLVMIIIPYISTVLSTLRQAAHLSSPPPKQKKKKRRKTMAAPLTPCPVCWFLMFTCYAISYWQPCVNLECTSDQILQEQITWSKIQCTHIWKQQVHFLYNFDCWLYCPQIFSNVPNFLEGRGSWAPKLKFLAWTLHTEMTIWRIRLLISYHNRIFD